MAESDSIPTHRDCTKCKECKPLSEFTKAEGGKFGRSARCRACAAEYAKQNKDKINRLSLERYHRMQEPIRAEKKVHTQVRLETPTKVCSGCQESKTKSEFGPRKGSVDGLHGFCRACRNEKNRLLRERLPEVCAQWSANWAKKNPEKRRAKYRRWASKPVNKLHLAVVSRVYECLKAGKQARSTESLIGYTFKELRSHLEKQFLRGMTWDNYGEWHVDHIIPLSTFHIQSHDDPNLKAAWAMSNLRPLWATDNLKKSAKRLYLL